MSTVDATVELLGREAGRTALLLDYDGSLAPIVPRPDDAVPLPGTAEVLGALAGRLALVGIVSGRPVDFLLRHVAAPGVRLVGQYGLEWVEDGEVMVDPRALPYTDAVAAAADEAERRWPELLLERKGRVALGLHWRTAPGAADGLVGEIDDLADRFGLAVHPSKMARELRPPIGVDKGSAVEQLLTGVDVGGFAGDDAGDLPAFAALDRLAARGDLVEAVRIAVASSEAPPEVLAQADLVVDGPAGLRVVLDTLAGL